MEKARGLMSVKWISLLASSVVLWIQQLLQAVPQTRETMNQSQASGIRTQA